MNLKHFINKSNNEYEIIISGEVGFNIDGKAIANEIRYLNSIGAIKITERINSPGGYVWDGYDIIDANLNATCIIETIVTGLAASTAAFIAVTGTKGHRFIVDYGQGMIHDPAIGNKTIEQLEEGSDKEGLVITKNSIATILSNNSNIKLDKINELMTAETWLNAENWVSMGFADEIIKTNKKVKYTSNILEFVNMCDELNKQDENPIIINKMKAVLDLLKLSADAQESSALSAIQKIENRAKDAEEMAGLLTTDVENLNLKVAEKDNEILDLTAIVTAYKLEAIKNVVDSSIKSGKFDESARESLTKKAEKLGIENFNEMIELVKLPQANVINQISNNSNGVEKLTVDQKLAEKYQNLASTDPSELKRIKNDSPAEFEKMFNAWDQA